MKGKVGELRGQQRRGGSTAAWAPRGARGQKGRRPEKIQEGRGHHPRTAKLQGTKIRYLEGASHLGRRHGGPRAGGRAPSSRAENRTVRPSTTLRRKKQIKGGAAGRGGSTTATNRAAACERTNQTFC